MTFVPFWSIEDLSARFAGHELSSVEAVTELFQRHPHTFGLVRRRGAVMSHS
jgi:hypothetical protein